MSRLIGSSVAVGLTVAASVLGGVMGSADGASPSIPPGPSAPSMSVPILPGEPWIVYQGAGPDAAGDLSFGLRLMRPDGTDDHIILPEFKDPSFDDEYLDGAVHPDWSPDGSMIAFANGSVLGWPIWTANADGSAPKAVIPCDEGCQVVDYPAWSPDGSRIAYFRNHAPQQTPSFTNSQTVEILDLGTGKTRIVLETTGPEWFSGPRWSPDGDSLVLSTYRTDAAQETVLATAVVIADVRGTGRATPRVLTGWDMFATYPDWRPTGDQIVFNTYDLAFYGGTDEPSNLFTIRADGSGLTRVTDYGHAGERATQPTWTPDGTHIIFTHTDQHPEYDEPRHTAFIDPDGGGLRILELGGTHARLRPTP